MPGVRRLWWQGIYALNTMSCSRVVKRNRGSGYEKDEVPATNALNNDLAAKLAERAAQDAKLTAAFQTVVGTAAAAAPAPLLNNPPKK